ncbi:hypothetical protein sscle_03g031130 [Sclerotinia sclerotiorum 1980 UF-70]|uniref:Uncharacterized protein n=1 Tax=Sclerotinia sclerotiorum (strain ATCC 18683 / 1980 / Ss-1) TaxID=665079 RepID=A0A1D9Q1B8_SCLS1|nr:hypothetical protein sscle_03g031130 [Sclerotinia sclerotiorum 1980 UF-70]
MLPLITHSDDTIIELPVTEGYTVDDGITSSLNNSTFSSPSVTGAPLSSFPTSSDALSSNILTEFLAKYNG